MVCLLYIRYILYKQPNIDGENGLKYLYMDESTNGWIPGLYNIDDRQSAVGQTLKPLFDNLDSEVSTNTCIQFIT